jgi:hypothetical protein
MYCNGKITKRRAMQMIKVTRRIVTCALFGFLSTISEVALTGCRYFPESTFRLASESRPPKWIALPPGLSRADASITMEYYVKPWGSSATFVLADTKGEILKKVDAKVKCREPFQLKNPPRGSASGYPSYEAITVDAATEIIEHRKMEPIFYITDDTAVWEQYRQNGCG